MVALSATSAARLDGVGHGVVESTAHSKVTPRGPDGGKPTVKTSNNSLLLLSLPLPPPLPLIVHGRVDCSNRPLLRVAASSLVLVVPVAEEGRSTSLLHDIPSSVVLQ